jgi:6-pyruvoyltetrahydropterin/6-carboxytetrahydropterin synthase
MATWRLFKSARFEASHQLPLHGGKCQRLHGHSWVVWVEITGDRLQEAGPSTDMVQDFYDIGTPLKRLVEERLDHYHLNDTTGLANPTSETLARWIYEQLVGEVPGLSAITVDETCTSRCEYRP